MENTTHSKAANFNAIKLVVTINSNKSWCTSYTFKNNYL